MIANSLALKLLAVLGWAILGDPATLELTPASRTQVLTSAPSSIRSSKANAEAPFFLANGDMIVGGSVGGHLGWFVLDSGSSVSWLDQGVADDIATKKSLRRGINGTTAYEVKDVKFGGAALPSAVFLDKLTPEMVAMKAAFGVPISGIIGYNVLRMMSVGLDFDRMKASFWGPASGAEARRTFFDPGLNLEAVPILCQDGWPRIEAKFNDQPIYPVLDTGSTFVTVPGSSLDWFGNDVVVADKASVAQTARSMPAQVFFPKSISIGGAQLLCVPSMEVAKSEVPPVIGFRLLALLHRVLIDFDGGSMQFVRPQGPVDGANSPLLNFGTSFDQSGALEGLAFWDKGLQREVQKDQIVTIGGVNASLLGSDPKLDWRDHAFAVRSLFDLTLHNVPIYLVFKEAGKQNNLALPAAMREVPALTPPTAAVANEDYALGPGVYWVKDGSPAIKAGAKVMEPAPDGWRESVVGGIPSPNKKPGAGRTRYDADVAPVENALDKIADFHDFIQVIPVGRTKPPVLFSGKKVPVGVPSNALVQNSGFWTPAPYGKDMVLYYPPHWKIPLANDADVAPPKPTGLAYRGYVWTLVHGQWVQMFDVSPR